MAGQPRLFCRACVMKDRQLCQSNCHHEITPTVLSYQEQGTYTIYALTFAGLNVCGL